MAAAHEKLAIAEGLGTWKSPLDGASEISRADLRFAMKKLLLVPVVLSVSFFMVAWAGAATPSRVFGYVSDSVCGTKGATVGYADCTTKCLAKGAQLVIVVDGTQQMLTIDNPDAVKGHECHHVLVTGEINIKTNAIHVYSLRII